MRVIGKRHHHALDNAQKYKANTVVECECGQRFVRASGNGFVGPYYYWEEYDGPVVVQEPIIVKMPPGRLP